MLLVLLACGTLCLVASMQAHVLKWPGHVMMLFKFFLDAERARTDVNNLQDMELST